MKHIHISKGFFEGEIIVMRKEINVNYNSFLGYSGSRSFDLYLKLQITKTTAIANLLLKKYL